MSGDTNWKLKYDELKAKYMKTIDLAYRLGVEEGMKQGQLDSANQQLQQAQADKQNMMPGGAQPGQPNNNGAPGTPDQGAAPDRSGAPSIQPEAVEPVQPVPMTESENPAGSELDQHISTLESMLSKSETDPADMIATVHKITALRKAMVEQSELRKSARAIPAIARALHKPEFKFGVNASHNLDNTAKSAATMQHKIVTDIMQKWESEEKKGSKDILSALNVEGIIKGK